MNLQDYRWEEFLGKLPEASLLEDTGGNILGANEEACRTLGYEKEELLQLEISDIWEDDISGRPVEKIKEAVEKERALKAFFTRKDRTQVHVDPFLSPASNPSELIQ